MSSTQVASSAPALARPAPAAAATPGRLTLAIMLSGTFMVVLDFFIVNVALPALQGDMFGRRRMFMLGLLLFTLASAACGLAPGGDVLIVARVAQGLAGALLQPQVLAMIGLTYAGEARVRAFAAYGVTLGLGATLGQLIGGALIHADLLGLGWRSCFLINLPIGAAALLLAPRALPPLANAGTSRLDPVGMLLVAAASVAVVLPLVEGRELGWPAWAWVSLAAAVPLLAAFGAQQRRVAARGGDPLVAPALLTDRVFIAGLLTTLAFYVGNASLYFVLALFLQQGRALGPLTSGIVFTSLALGFFATSMAAPRLAKHFGGAPIARGALLLAAGHALQYANVSGLGGDHVVAWMVPLLAVQGAGLGLVMAPLVSAVLAGLPPQHAGVASGVLGTVQQAGNALGVALIGLLFYGRLDADAGAHAYAQAFGASLLYLTASALLVAVLYRRVRRPRQ